MIKALLFDLGETLYTYKGLPPNWATHYRTAWMAALAAVGEDPQRYDVARAGAVMERYNTRLVAREREFDATHIFGEAMAAIGLTPRHRDGVVAAYFDYFRHTLTPYPEARDVLDTLRAQGIATGALTDVAYGMPARYVEDDLRRCGLLERLDAWRTSVQVGYRKPHPHGYRQLCETLGVAPTEAAYVGNEEKDVAGARAAGLCSILVARAPGPPPGWGQDHTISTLTGCLALLGAASP